MPTRSWSTALLDVGGFDVDDELARLFGGVRPLHLEQALFDAILAGWVRQQRARLLSPARGAPRARNHRSSPDPR